MRQLRRLLSRTALMAGLGLMSAGHVMAQAPFVPPEFYNATRPDFGNRLPLCILPESATATQDREMARSIAQALLMEAEIVEMDVDMSMLDEAGIWPVIFESLAESCVGVMGVQIIPGEITPDWMTLSRPYLEAPYVLVSRDESTQSLSDLEDGTRLGVPLFTPIDTETMTAIQSGALAVRRLPYDRPELMARLMREGELDAAIVWSPHLENGQLGANDFYSAVGTVAPLQRDTRSIAILLRQQDQMLRTLIDQAIATVQGF